MATQTTGMQAMIPKARGMYAKRLKFAEYEEMMRRRTVPEVAAILKAHPYFEHSLAALTSDPHRGQIEELMGRDIFKKYESLARFDYEHGGFSEYYLDECAAKELLRALHLLSIGRVGAYTSRVPAHLVGKTSVDLFALAEATNLQGAAEAAKHSVFYKILLERAENDPTISDYPALETAILRVYYASVFERIAENFEGREKESVSRLFLQEAETHNLQMILRVKTYFPEAFDEQTIRALMIPYKFRVPGYQMNRLIAAPDSETFITIYRSLPFVPELTSEKPDEFTVASERAQYHTAQRMLHLTPSPFTALAAFVKLAVLQRDNVVNIVEGVRYKMAPEEIHAMLHY